jgi:hypothetical protein
MGEKPTTIFAFPQFLSLHVCCPHCSSICNIISHLRKLPVFGNCREKRSKQGDAGDNIKMDI